MVANALQGSTVPFARATFPDPLEAFESSWTKFLVDTLHADERCVIVGHSSGAALAMRYAEKHRVRGLVLVGAYHSDLDNELERGSGYFDRPWDWEAIRANCGFIVQFHATNDHLVPVEEARFVAQQLKSEYHELPEEGHFDADDFPQLLDALTAHVSN